ncbi:hypothetical protein Q8W37_18485 [Shimia thalassica]|uniref:hypothetical protein n=2 Tax=Pseudomonadota TaxID=1224 RepID=UPI0026E1AEAD|nr:hypothetical protein [Shimia thalassica]MDO6523692.1 hypothetical protein [Shimia thalassica]MDP2496093.1 hypothetical protein [Shimia thalassica]MDP2581936.1 hypothetical protein [Shimia thalassica]
MTPEPKQLMRPSLYVGALVLPLLMSTSALAQSAGGDWSYKIAPYFWGTGLSGTIATSPALPPADVDASFGDIWDNLDFAAMVVGHANNGRFGFTGDLQYFKLGNSGPTPGPAFSSVDVAITNKIYSLNAEYLLKTSSTSEVWGSIGARYWSVDAGLNFSAGTSPAASARSKNTWVDPMIGVRGRTELSGDLYLVGWAYAGGFGVGSDSSFDLFGALGYQFTPTTSGIIGYRWLSVDREDGSFQYDVEMEGLMAGVSFNF